MPATESEVYGIVLGRVIAQLRERRGLTQGAIAARVGIAQSTLSRIEKGHLVPDAALVRSLAAALGTTAARLTAMVERAMERTEAATQGATGQTAGPGTEWWEAALVIAGMAGLVALVAFAVAAALADDDASSRRSR